MRVYILGDWLRRTKLYRAICAAIYYSKFVIYCEQVVYSNGVIRMASSCYKLVSVTFVTILVDVEEPHS